MQPFKINCYPKLFIVTLCQISKQRNVREKFLVLKFSNMNHTMRLSVHNYCFTCLLLSTLIISNI